jgi:Beta-propeller repeat
MFKTFLRMIAFCMAILCRIVLAATSGSAPFDRPLMFEPNLGQAPAQVSWTARGQGYQLYLTSTGASIVVAEPVAQPASADASLMPGSPRSRPVGLLKSRVSVVGMNLSGSHAWSAVEGLEPTGSVANYMRGKDQKDWHTGIPQYGRVRVKGVYDGIDLVFYGHGHDLEYDFVVAPGGDPNQIRLAFDGAGPMQVDRSTGDLVIKTKAGAEMRHVRPRVYQQIGNQKVEVAGGYQILDNGQAAFRLAAYDRRSALVVDPTVEFTTFLEGNAQDYPTGIAVYAAGFTYVTGQTYSTDFPVLDGTTAAAKNCPDNVCPAYIFVTELTPSGKVVASALIGGSDADVATGIAVNGSGVWITGMTDSPNFPTHTEFGYGYWNGFVAKLSQDVSQLTWCVTFGGNGDDLTFQTANAIAIDADSNAYVAGYTSSADFPTTQYFSSTLKPKQESYGGNNDAFVVKVGPDGYLTSGYSTYLGGSNSDDARGIAVDSVGHAFVTGYTSSTDFPTNAAPSHGSLANGGTVAFVTELSKDGSHSLYSVLLGGTKSAQEPYPQDQGFGIVVDATDEAYVTGTSCTSDFPTNAHSFQKTPPSACLGMTPGQYYQSAFVAKLSATGSLLYSSYLGGTSGYVNGTSIAIDSSQNVYVAGITSTSQFPDGPNIALNPTAGFVTKFHPKLYTIESTIFLGAGITSIAEYEAEFVRGPVTGPPTPQVFTTGYRYRPGSPSLADKYLDGFIVEVAFNPPS